MTGRGTLDGSASDENWWPWARRKPGGGDAPARADILQLRAMAERNVPVQDRVFGQGHYLRNSFIQPYRSRNILIEDVRIINSPFWEIHPVLSSNVTVRGVNIYSHGPNNDGCDPESSRDVLIEDCIFDTGDDCIAIKSGRDADGRRVACRIGEHHRPQLHDEGRARRRRHRQRDFRRLSQRLRRELQDGQPES